MLRSIRAFPVDSGVILWLTNTFWNVGFRLPVLEQAVEPARQKAGGEICHPAETFAGRPKSRSQTLQAVL
jgi:hypothetical protein